MNVLSKLTDEYFGETMRDEDLVTIKDVEIKPFTDKNGKYHKYGYHITNGYGTSTLKELIRQLIDRRGNKCDLNDINVSNIRSMDQLFRYSNFNGDISGWMYLMLGICKECLNFVHFRVIYLVGIPVLSIIWDICFILLNSMVIYQNGMFLMLQVWRVCLKNLSLTVIYQNGIQIK